MLFCYSSPDGLRHLSYECFIYVKIFYKVRKGSIQPLTKKKKKKNPMAAEFLAPRNLGKPLCNNKVLLLARYTHDILKKLKNKTLKSCWFAKI